MQLVYKGKHSVSWFMHAVYKGKHTVSKLMQFV